MLDSHLINMALAGLSISAGAAIVIAAAIIGIALALRKHPLRGSSVAETEAPVITKIPTKTAAPSVPERLAA